MDRFQKRKATKEKRKRQTCRVFELKIDYSRLSSNTKEQLRTIFKEAKWFYNYCLSHKNLNDSDTAIKTVPVKTPTGTEHRKFIVLSGAMKQAIKTRLFSSLKSLSALKKNGHKVGRLKFKSVLNSIGLQQYKKVFDLNFKNNTIKIQNIPQYLKIHGMHQITPDLEIANAHLVRKPSGYYIHITTYKNKTEQNKTEQSIGIDFGCDTQLTLSNGIKIQYELPVPKRLKKLDRKINKHINGKKRANSKNKRKDQFRRQKYYERLTNKKKDIRNKIVSAITKHYKYVCVQDESIKAWQSGRHGKKIQNTGIGSILSALKHKAHTPILVDRFFPSTQLCPECGIKNKLTLDERVYECKCGFMEDRDIKSAVCIEREGMKNIPMDCRDYKPEESCSSACFELLSKISNVKISKNNSMSQEATGLAPT